MKIQVQKQKAENDAKQLERNRQLVLEAIVSFVHFLFTFSVPNQYQIILLVKEIILPLEGICYIHNRFSVIFLIVSYHHMYNIAFKSFHSIAHSSI